MGEYSTWSAPPLFIAVFQANCKFFQEMSVVNCRGPSLNPGGTYSSPLTSYSEQRRLVTASSLFSAWYTKVKREKEKKKEGEKEKEKRKGREGKGKRNERRKRKKRKRRRKRGNKGEEGEERRRKKGEKTSAALILGLSAPT